MINLLPPDDKAEIRAGRLNIILLNYIVMTLLAMALLAVLFAFSFFTLISARHDAQRRVNENSAEIAKYKTVEDKANEYRTSLITAKQILDNSTNYSNLVLKIARTVPKGVVLTNLSLDKKTLGTPMMLNFNAESKDLAFAFKNSLQKDKTTFSNVYIQQLDLPQNTPGPGATTNTISGVISVTVSKEALK